MTLRTLRYTHPKMCAGQKIDRNEIPVKRRNAKSKEENITPNIDIPEEVIVNHIRKEREKRNQEKVEKIKKLVASIV
jgi:hypothetical protein